MSFFNIKPISILRIGTIIFLFVLVFIRLNAVKAQDSQCNFRPITFVIEKKNDGKYYPLRSPRPQNWGVIYDRIETTYGSDINNYSAFNRIGEFDPCNDKGCEVENDTWGIEGFDDPNAQYKIKDPDGDLASVSLIYDSNAYKIIGQCPPNQRCQPLTTDTIPSSINNIPVKCGSSHSTGWVVERISTTDENDTPEPEPTTDPAVPTNPANPTKKPDDPVTRISGSIIIFHSINTTFNEVALLCQGTCQSKVTASRGNSTGSQTRTVFNYNFEGVEGSTYKLKPTVKYKAGGTGQNRTYLAKDYRTFTTDLPIQNFSVNLLLPTSTISRSPTNNPTSTISRPVAPTGSSSQPPSVENGISVEFIVRNAKDSTQIKNLYPIICRKDAGWIHYTDVFRTSRSVSSARCLKLDMVFDVIGTTTGAINQVRRSGNITLTKNYNGFSLKNGDEVKIGCQFDKTGDIFTHTCPLKSAIVGQNGIIHYITLSVQDILDYSDINTNLHNARFPLKFTIKNASKTKIINDVYPVICKKDAGWSDYNGTFTGRASTSSPKCLRLDKAADNIDDTTDDPDESRTFRPNIATNYNGFKLKEGEEVKIGCRFVTNRFGLAHICPLKSAVAGGDEVEQTIIVTVDDQVGSLSTTSTECEKDNSGNCKVPLQL